MVGRPGRAAYGMPPECAINPPVIPNVCADGVAFGEVREGERVARFGALGVAQGT